MKSVKKNELKDLLLGRNKTGGLNIGDPDKEWFHVYRNHVTGEYYDNKKKYSAKEIKQLKQNFNIIAVTIRPGNGEL